MKQTLRIDIISDVVCPWCIIGFKRLEQAMDKLKEEVDFQLLWHPFELNPQMGEEGENLRAHLHQKYGTTREDSIKARENLTALGKDLGFRFDYFDEMRMVNTFKAHQLLHWAGETSAQQTELKLALFEAFFGKRQDVNDTDVLVAVAEKVGLDPARARQILNANSYDQHVRKSQAQWTHLGISAVPAVIFDQKHLVAGAQESATFLNVMQQILEEKKESRPTAKAL